MGFKVLWLAVFIALAVGETVTAGLVCIWFAAGALCAFLAAYLGGAFWVQLLVFAVTAALALALLRPAAARHIKHKRTPTNADRVVGQAGVVTETVDNSAGSGQVSVMGQVWTARSLQDVVIPVGTQVEIRRIEGVKVLVETR